MFFWFIALLLNREHGEVLVRAGGSRGTLWVFNVRMTADPFDALLRRCAWARKVCMHITRGGVRLRVQYVATKQSKKAPKICAQRQTCMRPSSRAADTSPSSGAGPSHAIHRLSFSSTTARGVANRSRDLAMSISLLPIPFRTGGSIFARNGVVLVPSSKSFTAAS